MQTITFYSYKGGTGRTLLLSNVAMMAARLGKSVVTLDLDLEAPGLIYKFFAERPRVRAGAIDWLHARYTGLDFASLDKIAVDVPLVEPFTKGGWLRVIPPGDAPSPAYFGLLRSLAIDQRIETDGGRAFRDLQRAIEREYEPDYLMIDSRTGITATNLVTTRVLADGVVVLTLDTPEQLEGTRSVLRGLQPLTSLRTDQPLDLHIVRARAQGSHSSVPGLQTVWSTPQTRGDEQRREAMLAYLNEPAWPVRNTLSITRDCAHVVHADTRMAAREYLPLAEMAAQPEAIHKDYLAITWGLLPALAAATTEAITQMPEDRRLLGARTLGRDDLAVSFAISSSSAASALGGATDEQGAGLTDRAADLRRRAESDPLARVELADVLTEIAEARRRLGDYSPAVEAAEELVAVWRDLVANFGDDAWPRLVKSLVTLSGLQARVGAAADALATAEEATEAVHEGNEGDEESLVSVRASALDNLGIRLSELGRRGEALAPTEEAVTACRELAATNPAYLPDLAGALNNLGNRLSEVGRRDEALAPTEEAVTLYRELAATNPAYLPDLAMSLNNLGIRLSNLGRRDEALAPTEEAVTAYRELAAANPAYLPYLAGALNNLGIRLSNLGRRDEALAPTEEAVTLRRGLAEHNTAYLPDLASSLHNLGVCLSELGRRDEALPPTEEAVTLRRGLAEHNTAYLPDLAMSLNNLGIHWSNLGRRDEALPPTEEAVTLYRELAADNPAYLPDLAMSLTNLGIRLSELGRRDEALPLTEEAVTLYRELAADNPAYLPDLAMSLNNLAIRLSNLGRRDEALPPVEEAVTAYRGLAEHNPAYRPDLASALNNLAFRLAALGRRDEALPLVEEAATLYRRLAEEYPERFTDDLLRTQRLFATLQSSATEGG